MDESANSVLALARGRRRSANSRMQSYEMAAIGRFLVYQPKTLRARLGYTRDHLPKEGGMWAPIACEALRTGSVLELRYDGFWRHVEVHAVGFTKDDNGVMRVWQTAGGSVGNEPVGWKLLRIDEVTGAALTKGRSLAPRPGYKRGDRAMERVTAEL